MDEPKTDEPKTIEPKTIEQLYSEKRKPYIVALREDPTPPKHDALAYMLWLEKRLECVTHLMLIEMNHKQFPQEDFGRQEFILEIPEVTGWARTPKRDKSKEGFVYLLQAANGSYKIGRTINPRSRLATFRVKLPFEVEYLHLIKTSNMFDLESQLHRRFAKKRLNRSEFFALHQEDIEYICSLKGDTE